MKVTEAGDGGVGREGVSGIGSGLLGGGGRRRGVSLGSWAERFRGGCDVAAMFIF